MSRLKRSYEVIPIQEVIDRYDEVQPTGKFFAPDAISFFKSNSPKQAYYVPDTAAFFVTGEQSPQRERLYTIRRMDWETGEIENVGPFNVFQRSNAHKIAKAQANKLAMQKG